jgi:hypothetical protein
MPRARYILLVFAFFAPLSSACSSAEHNFSPHLKAARVCENTSHSTADRDRAIAELESSEGFTFSCPSDGSDPLIQWLDPGKAAAARLALESIERPEPVTIDVVTWTNTICAMPPGPQRTHEIEQMSAHGFTVACPN